MKDLSITPSLEKMKEMKSKMMAEREKAISDMKLQMSEVSKMKEATQDMKVEMPNISDMKADIKI